VYEQIYSDLQDDEIGTGKPKQFRNIYYTNMEDLNEKDKFFPLPPFIASLDQELASENILSSILNGRKKNSAFGINGTVRTLSAKIKKVGISSWFRRTLF